MQLLKSCSKRHWHWMWYPKGIPHPKFMAINQVHSFKKTVLTMELQKAANPITKLGAQRLQSRQSNQAITLQPRVQKEPLPSTLRFQNSLSWKAVSEPGKSMPPSPFDYESHFQTPQYILLDPWLLSQRLKALWSKKSAFAVLRQTESNLLSSAVLILRIPETPSK